ncbi:MAG: ATP-binding protein [Archangium sp.]|nr:ATP-binding protein [Archangium sp.]MDP3569328.1 ATP-binding protein [Archangium sp.]
MNERRRKLLAEQLKEMYSRRSRIFFWLMLVQWAAAIVLTLTWPASGGSTSTAVILGGLIGVPAMLLAALRPDAVFTRHAMAVAQLGYSAVLSHLTGGHLETHFHVLGSLVFLAFYRDWGVLLTGTLMFGATHLFRAMVLPASALGPTNSQWWSVGFVLVVLMLGVREALREMREVANSRIAMEESAASVEARAAVRTAELEASREQYRTLIDTTHTLPWRWLRSERRFISVGQRASTLLGCSAETWLAPGFWKERLHPADVAVVDQVWARERGNAGAVDLEFRLKHDDGSWVWVRSIVGAQHDDTAPMLQGIMLDVTLQKQLENELNQAQKLESVGRLASGIAHEINTPIQFVGDSIQFISDAFSGLLPLIAAQQTLHRAALKSAVTPELIAEVTKAEEEADLDYVLENVPLALEQSVEGLERVATLVRSMKEFAHPDAKEKAAADLNRAIESTLVIARNEFKYVADVTTKFGDLPPVTCHLSELNQVFLNIIVNAAHAIGERVAGTSERGLIRIRTRMEGGQVEVAISDTGGGIPDAVRQKIFEPFFTTKPVGKGTGQGLAIARSVVVEKHQGTLTFETQPGVGTTFFIRIPCEGAEEVVQQAA